MCVPDAPLAYGGPGTTPRRFRAVRYGARSAGGCSVFFLGRLGEGFHTVDTTGGPPRPPQRYRFEPHFVRLFDLDFKHKVPCSIFNVTVALWRRDEKKIHVEAQVSNGCRSRMGTVLVVPRN